jgi:hypothetical protein
MAYLPGFDYDIFISYAHVNNQTADAHSEGWVTLCQRRLEMQLSMLVGRQGLVKVWRDPALDGNQLFDQTIQDRLNRAAIFLALFSFGYLHSEYCQQELKWFCDKAQAEPWGLSIGDRMRVFNLLLNNIEPAKWPKEFGRTSGYCFYAAEQDDDIGFPSDPEEPLFRGQLLTLVKALYRTLEAFKAAIEATSRHGQARQTSRDHTATGSRSATIFLADTADSLRLLRRRIANELQQQGITLSTPVPPPYEVGPHDEKVITDISRAHLAVHLLDEWPGREMDGAPEQSYPQRQVALGLQHARAQLIWVPSRLDTQALQAVDDVPHRELLTQLESGQREPSRYSFIRASQSEITREIFVRLDQLKQAAAAPRTPSAVLLDTHLKDQLHAMELGRFLLERNIQPYINPEEDDPSKNIRILEERLKQVSRLIIVFGSVAEEWVRARLGEAVKIAVIAGYQLKACGIYFAPPRRKAPDGKFNLPFLPVYQFDSQDLAQPQSLLPLFNGV